METCWLLNSVLSSLVCADVLISRLRTVRYIQKFKRRAVKDTFLRPGLKIEVGPKLEVRVQRNDIFIKNWICATWKTVAMYCSVVCDIVLHWSESTLADKTGKIMRSGLLASVYAKHPLLFGQKRGRQYWYVEQKYVQCLDIDRGSDDKDAFKQFNFSSGGREWVFSPYWIVVLCQGWWSGYFLHIEVRDG